MNYTIYILFALGLLLLIAGAELLVRGASRLAASIGMSPLIIGLTVVAIGTSSPELAVSIQSGLAGQADIALGNVVGSNIFNILFILGLSAIITPLFVSSQLIRFDVPFMIVVSMIPLVFGLNGHFGRWEGIICMLILLIYIVILIHKNYRFDNPNPDHTKGHSEAHVSSKSLAKWIQNIVLIGAGLTMLIFGSRWFIMGAVEIATSIGISQLVIGITIVSAGTSLPEVATSVVAAFRGERDMAVGNVVGSNLFNILAVLGVSSIVTSGGIAISSTALHVDIPVMIIVAVACLPILFTGHTIARWEGVLFFGYYIAYTTYIVLSSLKHTMLPTFNVIMSYLIIPITVSIIVATVINSIRFKNNP